MATPPYIGQGQPVAASNDWFSKIASLFSGSSTPAYRGVGQPTPMTSDILRGTSTPIYAVAPTREAAPAPDETARLSACDLDCPIDPAALAAGQIAIVIPRERLGPQQ